MAAGRREGGAVQAVAVAGAREAFKNTDLVFPRPHPFFLSLLSGTKPPQHPQPQP